jgi:Zinc carboxypeptidase
MRIKSLIISFLFIILSSLKMPLPEQLSFSQRLFQDYEKFLEPSLKHRRFKHKHILPLIQELQKDSSFAISQVGESVEGRSINQIKIGSGKTKVLLWSQMHGDEPTATMAIFDIFKFLQAKNDGFDLEREKILSKTTLYFVPMLNPDGAERYQRRNALNIDLNRDALRLQSPEAKILKNLQQTHQPEFGFNLHDQGTRYSAGESPNQATISFLATAYNHERSINDVRKKSMQLIVDMNDILQEFIPGHVAKFSDEHEPRAFGDNIQKWGTTLVLIESGGYKTDREKQYIRKLNFVSILSGLLSIADKHYKRNSVKEYENIPENARSLFDLLVRNATFENHGKVYTKDIGINLKEENINNATAFLFKSTVEDLGDLSTFWGIQEIDATGMKARPFAEVAEKLKGMANLHFTTEELQDNHIKPDENASFVLEKDDKIEYIIQNGQVVVIE